MLSATSTQFLKTYLVFGLLVFLSLIPISFLMTDKAVIILISNACFLFFITLITGVSLIQTIESRHFRFMLALTAGTFSKLLIAPLFLYLLITQYPQNKLLIVFSFLTGYLLFTGFELFQLFRNLRPHLKKEEKSENR